MANYQLKDLPRTISEFNQNHWIFVDPDDGSGGGKMRASLFQGPQGEQGPTGATGAQGIQGPQGLTGQQGSVGPQGPAGSNGINGAPGAAGSDGADGRSFWGGVGVPSNELGQNDDVYLNLSNGDLYQKTGGVYSYVSNLTGPTGATGPTGPQGPAGVVFQDSNPSRTDQLWVDTDDDPEAAYSVVPSSGGTFTGAVTFNATSTLTNAQPQIELIETDAAADEGRWRLTVINGDFYLYGRNDDGTSQISAIKVDRNGTLILGGTGLQKVNVPVASAAQNAAQVSAIDPTTGRLAIGGIEMGDTGWRDVSADLINGWTIPVGKLVIRRSGNVGMIVVRAGYLSATAGPATADRYYSLPDGWGNPFYTLGGVGQVQDGGVNLPTINGFVGTGATGHDLKVVEPLYSLIDVFRPTMTWLVDEPWPTTLPGIPYV